MNQPRTGRLLLMVIGFIVVILAAITAAITGTVRHSPSAHSPTSLPGESGSPAPAGSWLTYHHDNLRSGVDTTDGPLSPTHQAWTSPTLDGGLYAEPLVDGGLVIAATTNDTVYALNATNGAVVWRDHLATPVPGGDLPCGNIDNVGIISTPAIDPATNELFVAGDTLGANGSIAHVLWGIDTPSGNVKLTRGVDAPGMIPANELQRAALAVANGYAYVSYGGNYGDCGTYHGWVVGVPENGQGANISFQVPSGNGAAIWGGGDGPSVDPATGDLYVATGNSFATSTFDYGESVIRLSPQLAKKDYFAPTDWAADNGADADLGSTGPLLLPGSTGTPAKEVFIAGKETTGYLLNAASLGHVGGEQQSLSVCFANGGYAFRSPDIYVPCSSSGSDSIEQLVYSAGSSPPSVATGWTGPAGAVGPPILAGGLLWSVDYFSSSNNLFGINPATGATVERLNVGSVEHFATPAAGDGMLFVGTTNSVVAFAGPTAYTAYVPVSTAGINGLATIDTASHVAGAVDSINGNDTPQGVAISADGTTAYVTTANGLVVPVDLATGTAAGAITVKLGDTLGAVAISPDGSTAWVVDTTAGTVVPVSLPAGPAGAPIAIGAHPLDVAISPDGATAYVTEDLPDGIVPVSTSTKTAGTAITGCSGPGDIAITPDGTTAFVACIDANTVVPLDLTTAPPTMGTAIGVGSVPFGVAITPDGATAYVTNDHGSSVTPISVSTKVAGAAIAVSAYPYTIAITPDGREAYIAQQGGTEVMPIDLSSGTALPPIAVPNDPGFIAISPDEAPTARLAVTPARAGLPAIFDASGSTAPQGTIASYAWTFGDAATATTTSPVTTHTYASAGTYTASVTETDTAGTSTVQVFTGHTVSREGKPSARASATVVAAASGFPYHPLTPTRITDTRAGTPGPNAGDTLAPGGTLDVALSGVGPVPSSGATAVVLNVTATNTTATGYLTVWPAGEDRPLASDLNMVPGRTVANLVTVRLGAGGRISVYNFAGTTDVVVDVEGFYGEPAVSGTGLYNPLVPTRIADTRTGSGEPGTGKTLVAGTSTGTLTVQVDGAKGVPSSGVAAAVLNLTATNTSANGGYFTVWPAGAPRPLASNLNWSKGETVANRVIVPVSASGQVDIAIGVGSADAVVDVGGWFTNGSGITTGSTFSALSPARICDTRAGSGTVCAGKTLTGSTATATLVVTVDGAGGVPATGVTGLVANVTATNTTAWSYLTVWPDGATMPLASDVNWTARQVTVPNLVVVKVGAGGKIDIANAFGSVDVIVDVAGWFG